MCTPQIAEHYQASLPLMDAKKPSQRNPSLTEAFEKLRRLYLWIHTKEVTGEWLRQQRGGEEGLSVLIDSQSSWGSTLAMADRAVVLEESLGQLRLEGAPALLTRFEWMLVKESLPLLDLLGSATDRLQGRFSPFGQVVPAVMRLKQELASHKGDTSVGNRLADDCA